MTIDQRSEGPFESGGGLPATGAHDEASREVGAEFGKANPEWLWVEREPGVTEAAWLLAHLMPTFPEDTITAAYRLLDAKLSFPNPATLRRKRLAVLLAFMLEHDRAPSADEYQVACAEREAAGLEAMPLSTVERHYGSYANAVDVAARLHVRGTASRVPYRKPENGHGSRHWTPDGVTRSIWRARKLLGHWPRDFEYFALQRSDERLRSARGLTDLELCPPKRVERLFGSYANAVREAQKRAAKAQQDRNRPRPQDPDTPQPVRRRRRRAARIRC